MSEVSFGGVYAHPSDPKAIGGNASPKQKLAISPLHPKARSPCTKPRQHDQILKGKRILERYRELTLPFAPLSPCFML